MANIVVIEDDRMVREMWLDILELKGHEAHGFDRGESGIEEVMRGNADLVLVDLGLPDMEGSEVVAEIRREFSASRLPIVVLSGSEQEHDIEQAFGSGATDYLVKPVGASELAGKISLHLRESQRMKRLTLTSSFLPGEVACGKFLIEEVIGQGSYGVVYGASDLASGQGVALKIMTSETPVDRSRFLRECYTLATLDHPGIVKVVDYGEVEGTPYLAMERVHGVSLEEWQRQYLPGSISPAEVWCLVMALTGAMEALEKSGILHRDIKPTNIMLRDGALDAPVLIDFGLAKRSFETGLTSPNVMLGTPGYLPPEVLAGEDLDSRSDLFALGMVARLLTTGRELHPHLGGFDLIQRMARVPVEMPQRLPRPFRRVLEDLTAQDVDDRLGSVSQLRARLEACRPQLTSIGRAS